MVLPKVLAAALTLFAVVHADVEFVSPKAGATLKGGGAIEIEWKDSGSAPSISDLTKYELFLCAGGNKETEYVSLFCTTLLLKLAPLDQLLIIGLL